MTTHVPFICPASRREPIVLCKLSARVYALASTGAALLAAILLVGSRYVAAAAPELAAIPATRVGAPVIEVRGVHAEQMRGYTTVTGEAANVSKQTLKNIEAVVEFFDSSRRLLRVETALLELSTVRPGEEAPFSVQTRSVPGMAAYRVRFRHLLGPSIPCR